MSAGAFGSRSAESHVSEFNALTFLVQQVLSRIATATLVKVMKVTNTGGITPVGFVDVQPMVHQMTGERIAEPHSTIYNIPYLRLQGGADAIILDPKVGDIGVCVFCSSDISVVKKNKAPASPGSYRRFDWADGLYMGGFLNAVPTQYVDFASGGITIHSPTKVTVDAPEIDLNASTKVVITTPECDVTASTKFVVTSPDIELLGAITLGGSVTQSAGSSGGNVSIIGPVAVTNDLTAQGKSVHGHVHGGVQTGSGSTAPPT